MAARQSCLSCLLRRMCQVNQSKNTRWNMHFLKSVKMHGSTLGNDSYSSQLTREKLNYKRFIFSSRPLPRPILKSPIDIFYRCHSHDVLKDKLTMNTSSSSKVLTCSDNKNLDNTVLSCYRKFSSSCSTTQSEFFFFSRTDSSCSEEKMEEFKGLVKQDALLIKDFISRDEEKRIASEVEKGLARLKYQYDHWDGVIYGYREIEKSRWTPETTEILERIRRFAFDENAIMLPAVHVLDLSKEGYIKPHIDSKFCGPRIAGLSLLSTSVMRLKRQDDDDVFVDILLQPRMLYLMRGRVRYELTHEILSDKDSLWDNQVVPRERRISVMLREEPTS